MLRLYQPSNSAQQIDVALGGGKPTAVTAITALEDPIADGAPAIALTNAGFSITVETALNTVQVGGWAKPQSV